MNVYKHIFRTLVSVVRWAINGVIGWFRRVTAPIRNAIASGINWAISKVRSFRDFVGRIVSPVSNFFRRIGDGVKSGVSAGIESAKGIVKGGINWIIDRINSAISEQHSR